MTLTFKGDWLLESEHYRLQKSVLPFHFYWSSLLGDNVKHIETVAPIRKGNSRHVFCALMHMVNQCMPWRAPFKHNTLGKAFYRWVCRIPCPHYHIYCLKLFSNLPLHWPALLNFTLAPLRLEMSCPALPNGELRDKQREQLLPICTLSPNFSRNIYLILCCFSYLFTHAIL